MSTDDALKAMMVARADYARSNEQANTAISQAGDHIVTAVELAGSQRAAGEINAILRSAIAKALDHTHTALGAIDAEIDGLRELQEKPTLTGGGIGLVSAPPTGPAGMADAATPPPRSRDPFDELPPGRQRDLKDRLIEDSSEVFPLTEVNAEHALRGGPPGSTPDVAGPGGAGADVTFRDAGGAVVLRREVKCASGTYNSFKNRLKHAMEQVSFDGSIFIQVHDGADFHGWLHRWQRYRDDERLTEYQNLEVVLHAPSGQELGRYNLGQRIPRPDDEGVR